MKAYFRIVSTWTYGRDHLFQNFSSRRSLLILFLSKVLDE